VDGIPNANGSPVGGGQPVSGQFATFNFDNFMRGQVPVPTGAQPRLFYAGNPVQNYAQYAALATLINQEWGSAGWVPLAARQGVVPGTPFLPGEINPVDEKNKSAYLMARYDHRLENGIDFSGNLGVRYVQITRDTSGFQSFPATTFTSEADCANQQGTVSAFCALPASVRAQTRAFNNGAVNPSSTSSKFDFVLPSFNLKVDLGGGKLLRFGISKSIAEPDVGLVRNYFNVVLSTLDQDIINGKPQAPNVQAGNPLLKPMQSWNLDASFEWYFAKVGQLTFAVFDKRLKDVVTNGTTRQTFTNNGATFDGIVSTPINSPDTGKVKGFEIAYQQVYSFLPGWMNGFGLNANYTYVSSKGVKQSTLSETDPNVAAGNVANVDTSKLPLQGLSEHTVNFSPFYEKGPLSVRLAYSWRSKYLLTVRDVIVPFAPIMQEASGQLDASIFYDVTSHVKVGIQGVNLLNEITRTSQVINNDLLTAPRSWFMNDRRYTFILRGTF
jgi:TonB-dependent receptor